MSNMQREMTDQEWDKGLKSIVEEASEKALDALDAFVEADDEAGWLDHWNIFVDTAARTLGLPEAAVIDIFERVQRDGYIDRRAAIAHTKRKV